ncbi:MAG: hypothetical protein V3V33_04565 [Candidatus Lokiarchaeia archaeon]
MKEFNENFIEEITKLTIRQKILVIHVAIEYLVNQIIKLKLIKSSAVDDILRILTFHNKFKLLKENNLLDPECLFDPSIEKQKVQKTIDQRKKEGYRELEILNRINKDNALPSDKLFSFIPFLIADKNTLLSNIRVINSIRNVYVHKFFVEEDTIREKALQLNPVFNSDIWLQEYSSKIEIIGANTAYLLSYLILNYQGKFSLIEDDEIGLTMQLIGISSINYHFKIPPHWKIDKFELKTRGKPGSEFSFKMGNL